MAIQSMTGFARAEIEAEGTTYVWEIRSVNGRGLDIRLRTPPGYDRLEIPARQEIQKKFSRGSIQAVLTVLRHTGLVTPVVNEAFLKDIAGLAKRLEAQFGCTPASADGLLALKGVLELPESEIAGENREVADAVAMQSLQSCLEHLARARASEGAALGAILAEKNGEIETLVLRAEADPSRVAAVIRERLSGQVRQLMEASPALDESRLHQEAAFLATKADIREEIDRLKTHAASVRQLLENGGAIGRKLDFIAQEFNREANTLCSKANAASITAIGLELKVAIDQFREQVQNVE